MTITPLPQSKGLSLVWGYIRGRPRPYLLAIALGVAASGLGLLQPLVIRGLIRNITRHSSTGLVWPIVLLTGLFVIATVFSAVEEYVLEATGEQMVHEIRTRLSDHMLRLPLAAHHRFQAGDLISRVTADTTILRELVTTDAADALIGGITMLGSIAIMAVLDPVLLGCSLSVLIIGGIVIARLYPKARHSSIRAQRGLGKVSAALDRALRAIRTVKISQAEDRETARIRAESEAVRDAGLAIARFQATVDPVVNLCIQASLVIVLGLGAARVASGAIQLGDLIAFLMYLTRVVAPVAQLFRFVQQLQRGSAANLRLREVLDLPTEDCASPVPMCAPDPVSAGAVSVEFDDVTFGYEPGLPVLEHVSVMIPAGSRVAIVGPSGTGKTSMLSLLAGFWYPDQGRVLISGTETRDIPLPRLRALVGLVEQDAPILDGSIGDNISYAAVGSTPVAVAGVVERSGLTRTLAGLPAGLDTEAGASGSMLSGGERQRIAMARSLLAAPRLLLLDEVTSQLDSISERAMRDTITAAASADCTVIVVAHRLSTVLDADRIVVLRDRTVEAVGSHAQLMAECTYYRSLVAAQFLDTNPDTDDPEEDNHDRHHAAAGQDRRTA